MRWSRGWLMGTVATVGLCACAGPGALAGRVEGGDARRCLEAGRWVDRVEGDQAIVMSLRDPPLIVPLSELPSGTGEGAVLGPSGRDRVCEARVRARVGALRRALVAPQDNGGGLRLE